MKKVLIFGSTGSIGRGVLSVIKENRKDFVVEGLCINKNIKLLKKQAEEFSPKFICIYDEKVAQKNKTLFSKRIKLFFGEKGLEEFSQIKSDISVMAIGGIASLKPLLLNLKNTRRVLLASKETIVCGGDLVKRTATLYKSEIIPLDSEINALFQLLRKEKKKFLKKVYLTASGGVTLNLSPEKIKKLTAKEVLMHPVWKMGKRITVDSSTLINKGFEIVEAHHFFNLDYDNIEVLIHPQAKVHAIVEFKDGVKFASLHFPDMRFPIHFSLYYPQRKELKISNELNKEIILNFYPVKKAKFPLLYLIKEAARRKDNSLVIINAADEVAVDYFLKGRIRFLDIQKTLEYIFSIYPKAKLNSEEDIFFWDEWARKKTEEFLNSLVK